LSDALELSSASASAVTDVADEAGEEGTVTSVEGAAPPALGTLTAGDEVVEGVGVDGEGELLSLIACITNNI